MSIKLNYALKACIIYKVIYFDEDLPLDLFDIDIFHISMKEINRVEYGFDYDDEPNIEPENESTPTLSQPSSNSYFKYIEKIIDSLNENDVDTIYVKNPFSNDLLSINDFINIFESIKVMKNKHNLVFLIKN